MIRYFEDLSLGQTFGGPDYFLSEKEIIEFAKSYDPQKFHTDPELASASFFGQHVASGWQTMSIGMRLLVTGEHGFAGGMVGLGVESIRWRRPTLPNTILRMKSEVIQLSRSAKFPRHGLVKLHNVISNSEDVLLAEMTTLQIVELKSENSAL